MEKRSSGAMVWRKMVTRSSDKVTPRLSLPVESGFLQHGEPH
jgi:hypothetical protein